MQVLQQWTNSHYQQEAFRKHFSKADLKAIVRVLWIKKQKTRIQEICFSNPVFYEINIILKAYIDSNEMCLIFVCAYIQLHKQFCYFT